MWKWRDAALTIVNCPKHLLHWPIEQFLLPSPLTALEETASLSTRLLLHFLLDSIAVVGGVITAINWGLLFSLFSITVLFWTLLVWFPLCRNKAGQNTYLFFCAKHLVTTCYSSTHGHFNTMPQHHATTTICQATMKHKHHRSTKPNLVGKFSSWPSMHIWPQLKGRWQCRWPFMGRLSSFTPVLMYMLDPPPNLKSTAKVRLNFSG